MKCSNCGEEVKEGSKFCPSCGENMQKPKCPDCGQDISGAVDFCPNCGCNLKARAEDVIVSDAPEDAVSISDSQSVISPSTEPKEVPSQNFGSESNSSQDAGVKNKKKSLSDLQEDIKNAGTTEKILLVIACCCIGLLLIGAIGSLLLPDSNTSSIYDDDNSSLLSDNLLGLDDGIGDSELQVRILYDGDWKGSVGVNSSFASYSGTGDKIINLEGDSSEIVAAAIYKDDSGDGKLKVEIIKNGKVVKDASTTEEYGMVSLAN